MTGSPPCTNSSRRRLQWQDIEALRERYAPAGAFDPRKAREELRILFERFGVRKEPFNSLSETLYSLTQLHAPPLGSPEYNALRKKIRLENRKNRSFDDFDFLGFRFGLSFFVIQAALFTVAVLFTLGLDWIGPTLDHALRDNYAYHLTFFVLFALLDRLVIRRLEEMLFTKMAKQVFDAGLVYLSIELMQSLS